MSNLGLGVLINMLGGNEDTVKAVQSSIGKKIATLVLRSSEVVAIGFDDKTTLELWDDGQSCCEHRHTTSPDNLNEFVGATLLGVEIKPAPSIPYEGGDHEVQFLELNTDRGSVQFSNHNEHNGYYGGFSIAGRLS